MTSLPCSGIQLKGQRPSGRVHSLTFPAPTLTVGFLPRRVLLSARGKASCSILKSFIFDRSTTAAICSPTSLRHNSRSVFRTQPRCRNQGSFFQRRSEMSAVITARKPEIKTELPGPKARAIIKADAEFVNPAYPRPSFKLVAERGQGVWVEDVDGNIFLDCNAGVAVCSTGHCHPEVVRAIQEQAAQLIHMCGTDYYYRHMPALAQKLDEIVPVPSPTRTHFANSGTEAVETALKLAMHATGREKFIAFFNSFHGRTLGSLSLTSSKAAQRLGFKRQVLDVVHVPYPTEFRNPFSAEDCGNGGAGAGVLNWIEERLFKTTTPPEEVAAIVVEAGQGEGGYVPAPQDFLKGLRRICDQY